MSGALRFLPILLGAAAVSCGTNTEPPAPSATLLAFIVQPGNTTIEATISPEVEVAIRDSAGRRVASSDAVTLALGVNPSGATLVGTAVVNAVDGVARFTDLEIQKPGKGYTLVATSGELTAAASTAFDVVLDVFTISGGLGHTCGRTAGGAAYCWGNNAGGRLGDGTTTDRLIPVAVTGDLRFTSVSAGSGDHTCALAVDGLAYCWGSNGTGQLGTGTIGNQSAPTAVSGGLKFSSLTVGGFHSCGLTSAGTPYCWGNNDNGQLGDGTRALSDGPVAVAGGLSFVALTAGGAHTCGLTAVGAAYCWGLNAYGQLGDGTTTNDSVPVAVSGGAHFAALVAGFTDTCGLTASGLAHCWGRNAYGELGEGTTENRTVPTPVSGGLAFGALSAGGHTCGLTMGGAAYCWGSNQQGGLGNGTTADSSVPVLVSGGLTFATLSAGAGGHTCAVTTGGAAYCWGQNFYGQLGTGTTTHSTVPVLVSGS